MRKKKEETMYDRLAMRAPPALAAGDLLARAAAARPQKRARPELPQAPAGKQYYQVGAVLLERVGALHIG